MYANRPNNRAIRNARIYERYRSGESRVTLAREYGISKQRISVIVHRERDIRIIRYGAEMKSDRVAAIELMRVVRFMRRYGDIFEEIGKRKGQ